MRRILVVCITMLFVRIVSFSMDCDLRSIDAVDDKASCISYPNSTSPLNVGQDLYILVRMLNQDYAETIAGCTPHPWYFKPHTVGSVDLSAAINAPMLALSIGGKRCYATYSSTGPNGELSGLNREADSAGRFGYHTDLYFKHTVEPGELGLPVKLLGKDGKVGDGTQEILIVNANTGDDSAYNVWDLTNDSTSPRNATLKFVIEEALPGNVDYPSAPHSDGPHRTQDLVSEGIYIQTIDFDSTYDDEEANVWREVYSGLSSAVLNTPRIEGAGPATVYIWSENEDVFTPVGEGRQQIDGKWVLPVTISSGDSTVSFRMRGGTAEEGTTCKIYMSSSTSQDRADIGDVLENSAVSRTIRMRSKMPMIRDLRVSPIQPWGLAIDYSVHLAENEYADYPLRISIANNEESYCAKNLSGEIEYRNGKHRVYWNMAKDGITTTMSNAVVSVSYLLDYFVVDLSAGADAKRYPVVYFDSEPPGGFNTDEYKTSKLVFKRVKPGTFIMGEVQDNEAHVVEVTEPFYMGIFEVTQKQWELVVGSRPSAFSGEKLPVETVSYEMIRGGIHGSEWPQLDSVDVASFLGKLRSRTGMKFDLPTEAQWEYVCRAGTSTVYSYGNNAQDEYMWYLGNSNSKSHEVGVLKPNPWGFYDMHGNVWEWCLDWYGELSFGENPQGSLSGPYRIRRGGSWSYYALGCSSSYRGMGIPVSANGDCGFRIVRVLTE